MPTAAAEQEKQFIIMKKSIFIFAALFAATFANAQITLLQSDVNLVIGSNVELIKSPFLMDGHLNDNNIVIGYYILDDQTSDSLQQTLYIYDEDLTLVKSFTLEQLGVSNINNVAFISRNIFTNNNAWTWIRTIESNKIEIVTENGQVLATLHGYISSLSLLKIRGTYLLCNDKSYSGEYDIYSLPGNGEVQAISNPSPKRNARKVARDGQVFVQTDNNTYTLTGAEVK